MRFHHSTRRGRLNRLGGAAGQAQHAQSSASRLGQAHSLTSRWAQLSYCRQTNIHFNRRLPVEPPASLAPPPPSAAECAAELLQLREALVDPPLLAASRWSAATTADAAEQHNGERHSANEETSSSTTAPPTSVVCQPPLDARLDQLHLNDAPDNMQILVTSQALGGEPTAKSPSSVDSPAKHRRVLPASQQTQQGNHLVKLANKQRAELMTGSNSSPQRHQNSSSNSNNQKIDMELIRQKLVAQVEKHPFWSNKAARRMNLVSLDERRVFVYQLTSYCERRDLEWRYEPYRGGLVAGSTPFRRFEQLQQQYGAHLGSVSQPTTPTTLSAAEWPPASRTPAATTASTPVSKTTTASQRSHTPASGQRPFSYGMSTLQVPPHSADSADQQQQQQPFVFADSTTTETPATAKSPIRRSCSSAAASPLHQPRPAAHLRNHSVIDNSPEAARLLLLGQSTQQQQQQQRQMPSAELVWSIEAPLKVRPAPFVGYLHSSELPDSSFVKQCHGCQGRGRLKCTSCHGVGYEVCISCSGKGTLRSHHSGAFSSSSAAGSSRGSKYSAGGGVESSRAHDSGVFGGMWDSANDSHDGANFGGRRYDEPGGVTQGGSGASAWTSESCHFCHGAGQKRCWICAGRAYNSCLACAGTGQLRCYLNLNITWLNHRDEHILNNADSIIPKDRLRLSSGRVLLDEASERLRPVDGIGPVSRLLAGHGSPAAGGATCAADNSPADQHKATDNKQQHHHHQRKHDTASPPAAGANNGGKPRHSVSADEANQLRLISSRLLERHAATYKQERLLQQRQRVTQIECFVVNWEWKCRRGHFVIYGDDRKVYIAKYPFKSICNIT